ncbi:indolepyruvate ferredoxin oxidoreductase family protein [Aurantimonas sp. VKM B-3413]|uniref:indolepyruvate ferredoxin oxidoreductase family protein n=1 Tax=Aurantimonas sp. VKM B-3413 TaxID=2779401 RepID=UPI001E3BC037|nr:indolepyruvate ferredoxin oxidoreductase family protein [Aurantimonas sp. VKM B-3413]MCB8840055.1 indolepyruvate ferredoxin oxidoreductase family protein [Aurantimonas sp. VKM B-3413]
MALRTVSLGDKYDIGVPDVFLSGAQAIVRLTLMQAARDRQAGLATAGYVTGYRGSPLGGLDQQFQRSEAALRVANVVFEPGLNEDLAATALWGAQQAEIRGEGRYDGVFGIWYGKGPGVDRSGDAFRHANLAGTSRHGGVLALLGDDHTCESSTSAHQSEFAAIDAMMPIFHPAGVQEILDYGLAAFALSRFAGLWTTMKCVKDTIESTATVAAAPDRLSVTLPDIATPPGGRNIRRAAHPLEQEAMLHDFRLPAALSFIAANGLNRIVHSGGRKARIGVLSLGKSWLDVEQALASLGIDEVAAADLGLRLGKVGVPWPLEPDFVRRFAAGLETILVVEEKRGVVEPQLKEILYRTAGAPAVIGKLDEAGRTLFAPKAALDANDIAVAIGNRLAERTGSEALTKRVGDLTALQGRLHEMPEIAARTPYFCAGCPHNSSTRVPDGARAYAGIGCHYMVQWMDRATEGYTQMGAEGANWIGERHFSKRGHVFQNLGDGTYNHSGALALRAAAASGANVTYKILFNDAVAMTGGQGHEGGLTVPMIAAQVAAEGAKRIAIVSDEPDKHRGAPGLPSGVTLHHRSQLDTVQRSLAETEGLTVLVYDQTCAAEKRRRRKRGKFPDPDRRVVINERVCEGCGDCGVQSNCVAVIAVETEFGRKRQIDQSACNKDFSCLEGFCPSFVTVHGAKSKKAETRRKEAPRVPEPMVAELDGSTGIVITGVGGTGVVTIGAIIGMAAHLDGKGAGVIDMAGLAQKGGPVTSHVRIAPSPRDVKAIRVAAGEARLVIGCDLVTAASAKVRSGIRTGETAVVLNTHETLSGEFTRNVDFSFPTRRLVAAVREAAGAGNVVLADANAAALALFGDAIFANMLMLGLAWQSGALPIGRDAIHRAIALNGVDVEANRSAFEWGRALAHDPQAVPTAAEPDTALAHRRLSETLDEAIARRVEDLSAYQDAAYAERYRETVAAIRAAEQRVAPGRDALAGAAARQLYRLMAVKDEYEVGRLFTDGGFAAQLSDAFSGYERLSFHLAPPSLGEDGPGGRARKREFGPWMMRGFRLLARARRLRGTRLDPFRFSAERRAERDERAAYERTLRMILAELSPENYEAAVELAKWPETLKGFGPVRRRFAEEAEARRESAEAAFAGADKVMEAAE